MDQARHRRRRSIRLAGYDYSQPGAYFVTICAHRRACLFGQIRESELRLYQTGHVVAVCWQEIPHHFQTVSLDEWIIMPNHLHGILLICDDASDVGTGHAPPLPAPTIATIVGTFKSAATKRINDRRGTPGVPVWQRSYYEHIVRDERALDRIRRYIAANPAGWADDPENPLGGRRGGACPAPTRADRWRGA